MVKSKKITSKKFDKLSELYEFVNKECVEIVSIETLYDSYEASYGVYRSTTDGYRLFYYETKEIKYYKFCRICQYIRQSKYGNVYCVHNDKEKGLNEECDIDKFLIDSRLKELFKGEC